ncbi:MAG: dihydrodipicolinate synthase family protein [Succinivibrio sp.]|nr:dihydrodipicolinate synthase family protein [Succinivibrio sp.]
MFEPISGVIPVMITPYTDDNKIDYESLKKLIDWYIDNNVDALFAVCQSSEMIFLSFEERVALSKFVVEYTNKRVPVISSGHISDDIEEQKKELLAVAQTKPDALVLVSNHLDPKKEGTAVFKKNLDILLEALPKDLPLGVYECPAPYRRLLTDEEITYMAKTGRFVVIKDVSCDLETVKRRVELVKGTPLAIVNANAAIAYPAMLAGARGFCGVMNNVHPELYAFLLAQGDKRSAEVDELARFMSMAALSERYGYPDIAKFILQKKGILKNHYSRTNKWTNFLDNNWACDVVAQQIIDGTDAYKKKFGIK